MGRCPAVVMLRSTGPGRFGQCGFDTNNESILRALTGGRWDQTGEAAAPGVHCEVCCETTDTACCLQGKL